jgi:hypothetical protein
MKRIIFFSLSLLCLASCQPDDADVEVGTGSILGIVTDKATGGPVSAANVQLRPTGITSLTGNDGYFKFTDLQDGDYFLTVTKTEYTELIDNDKITVTHGKEIQRVIRIEKLPSWLRIVNDSKEDITHIDFGNIDGIVSRQFNIFNDSPESIEWKIVSPCDWIVFISTLSGYLKSGDTQAVVVTIDRDKLNAGNNAEPIYVSSNHGNRTVEILAIGKYIEPEVVTLPASSFFVPNSSIPDTFNGEITNVGKPAYRKRGFCYSSSNKVPTINDTSIEAVGTGLGIYSITSLDFPWITKWDWKTQYVRAWVEYESKIIYGNVQSFTVIDF